YPWDLLPDSGIKRPAAVVATRKMNVAIAALAVGRFGQKRGQSLALLGADGNLYRLEPNRKQAPSNNKLANLSPAQMKAVRFVPTNTEPRALATTAAAQATSGTTDATGMPLIDSNAVRGGHLQDYLKQLLDQAARDAPKLDKDAIAKTTAEGAAKKAE